MQVPPEIAGKDVVAEATAEDDEGGDFSCSCQVKTLSGNVMVHVPVSAGDTIMDCKQFLSEAPETCYVTNYVLRHQGVEVNDFAEIASLWQVRAWYAAQLSEREGKGAEGRGAVRGYGRRGHLRYQGWRASPCS